jgi:hypothetical protein
MLLNNYLLKLLLFHLFTNAGKVKRREISLLFKIRLEVAEKIFHLVVDCDKPMI